MEIRIRPAQQTDSPRLLELLNELKVSGYAEMGVTYTPIEPGSASKSLLSQLIDSDTTHIIIATEDELVIGLVIAYEIPKVLEGKSRLLIEEMVIDAAHRNQGIGSKLLKHLETMAIAKGINTIKVTTGTKLKANHFYTKHGYVHFENAYRKKL